MNKKGITDVATIGILTFVIAVVFLFLYVSITPMLSAMRNTSVFNQSSLASASLESAQTKVIDRLDYIFMFLFLGFFITSLIISWFVAAIPLFMFIYFLALVIITSIMAILSYVWSNMASYAALLSTIQTKFPITNHLMENFTMYMMILGFISLIVMYAKPQQ